MANDSLQVTGFFTLIMMIFSFGPLRNRAQILYALNPGEPFYRFLAGNIDLILLVMILAISGLLLYDIAEKWL